MKIKMALGLVVLIAVSAASTLARSPDMDKQVDQAAANVRKDLPQIIKNDSSPISVTWFDVRRIDDMFVYMYRVASTTLTESAELKRDLSQRLRSSICNSPNGKKVKAMGYRPGFIIYGEDNRKFVEVVCP